jgi:hypothetical protein
MPPLAAAAAALLVVPASAAPRPLPRLWSSRRARPASVRAAALRALPRPRLELWPQRLATVESTPPPSSAPPPPVSSSGGVAACALLLALLVLEMRGGDGGGDGGGDADIGWLRVFPHVLTASMANFLFGYHIGCVLLYSACNCNSASLNLPFVSNWELYVSLVNYLERMCSTGAHCMTLELSMIVS